MAWVFLIDAAVLAVLVIVSGVVSFWVILGVNGELGGVASVLEVAAAASRSHLAYTWVLKCM